MTISQVRVISVPNRAAYQFLGSTPEHVGGDTKFMTTNTLIINHNEPARYLRAGVRI